MTLIIGIHCRDGVVLGADGAATLGTPGQPTVRQATSKIAIIDDAVALGVSGPIGLSQRYRAEVEALWNAKKFTGAPEEVMVRVREAIAKHQMQEMKVASLATQVHGPAAQVSATTTAALAAPIDGRPRLFQFDQQGAPEMADEQLPFFAIGSGQHTAESFLAFIRSALWRTEQPRVGAGILAAEWCLEHAIESAPAYVAGPHQIVTLTIGKKGAVARERGDSDLQEHRQAIADARDLLHSWAESFTSRGKSAPPPKPAA